MLRKPPGILSSFPIPHGLLRAPHSRNPTNIRIPALCFANPRESFLLFRYHTDCFVLRTLAILQTFGFPRFASQTASSSCLCGVVIETRGMNWTLMCPFIPLVSISPLWYHNISTLSRTVRRVAAEACRASVSAASSSMGISPSTPFRPTIAGILRQMPSIPNSPLM